MKHYLLSVVTPSRGEPPSPEALEQIMRNVDGFHQELQQAGAWVFAGGLSSPTTATVVRAKDGDTLLTDGPYIEGKEYLGGLCIIKAPDLDAALDWGRKAARAITLPIEVRPFEGDVEG
ncbi:YciI family protein [Streptomyces sp. NPDC048473]|uniref:YciI family protein n=1 Tax=unclassified Streptomyces TaxID=2593676 RepID=UPI003717F985